MSDLIKAIDAKKLTVLYKHKQEADKLVSAIAGKIKDEAMKGRNYLSVDDMGWDNAFGDNEYTLANKILVDAGYTVAAYDYEYAPNGGRPDTFKAVKISW